MWELIRANKRKSVVLFVLMGACLLLLGYLAGSVFFPPDGGWLGLLIALLIWVVLSVVSFTSADSILLSLSGAKEVTPEIHPRLFHVVEEMKIAANLPAMPKVYIIDQQAPNAFATGIRPEKTAIAVTAGLLSRLNRDQLQGVVAHEMSHILNRDVLFVTFAGVMLGSIVIISQVFLRSLWFSGGSSRRYRSSKKAGGQLGLPLVALAVLFAILAPLLTKLLYLALSRRREYLADATAVRLTRYPEGLASALEKISSVRVALPVANKVTAPMYIISPLIKKGSSLTNLTGTHPPIAERIAILRGMQVRANYLDYQKAYARVRGKDAVIIPQSGLRQTEVIDIRRPSVEKKTPATGKKGIHETADLMRAVNRYAFLACACGLKIKVPPDLEEPEIACPRCGRKHQVPLAELAAVAATAGALSAGDDALSAQQDGSDGPVQVHQQLVYQRKGLGWESFRCACGRMLQISPAFASSHVTCRNCGRRTLIMGPEKRASA
jgi:heat shock protein HtpX